MTTKIFDYKEFRNHVTDMTHTSRLLKKEARRMDKRIWKLENWGDNDKVLLYMQRSASAMQSLLDIVDEKTQLVKKDLSTFTKYAIEAYRISKLTTCRIIIKVYWNLLLGIATGYIK